jgi:hypothetical protein
MIKRWGVLVVGLESGRVRDLPWLRFWSKAKADRCVARLEWARKGNGIYDDVTRFEAYDRKHEVVGDGDVE